MSKYDEWGVLKTKPWNDIQKGDIVQYTDARVVKDPVNGHKKRTLVTLTGTWDGEKVEFNDNENLVVRTTRWLTKI